MKSAKVAINIPKGTLKLAKQEVKAGRAKSLSALVSEAVDEKLSRNQLSGILDTMEAEFGKPRKADRAWARRVLGRSF
jgi:hypothetical protein